MAPTIPEIVESTIDQLKQDRSKTDKGPFTEDEMKQIREVVSDKGSALQNMSFAFGSFLAPIIGGGLT